MDAHLDKWQAHATNNSFTQKDIKDSEFEKKRSLNPAEVGSMIKKKGVCKKCEGIAYRDGSLYRCPRCGWSGSTISVEEYKNEEYWR